MAFDVAGNLYQRFMGRFSDPLSAPFADFAGVAGGPDTYALDVGCGPGALTAELVARLGPDRVVGVDPSAPFVQAAQERLPGVEIVESSAESLPFDDGVFDAALAQLVVLFMHDPAAGVAEMARVTGPGGVVALNVWDHAGGRGPLTKFWTAVRELWPQDRDLDETTAERAMPEATLAALLTGAGLRDVTTSELSVSRRYGSFDEWWEPHTLGVGPVGDYYRSLGDDKQEQLRDKAVELTPEVPFTVTAVAFAARGTR